MGNIFERRKCDSSSLLLFELFVALSLSVTYCFLVEYFAMGSPNNSTNSWVFTSCSIPGFHLAKLGDVWGGRLSGLLLSGWLTDLLLKDYNVNVGQYETIFALYQSFWLFLTVIFTLRHSLFINLGIFAGLMYNFTPASGLYFYPWDIPATLFFTLAVLFFERRHMFLMAAATCAGCFFKETVLVCALLPLFAGHWTWRKRIPVFAGIVIVYVLGKKLLLGPLQLNNVAAFSMGNATNLAGLLQPTILIENFKKLFSPAVFYILFVNAGTLAAVLVLGWRRRFLPYMALIIVYLAGQLMYGGINEYRIFMQVLPLSLILLSVRLEGGTGSAAADQIASGSAPAWALRETFPVLIPITVVLIGLSTGLVAWRYYSIYENLQPGHRLQSELGKHTIKPEGGVRNLVVESESLRQKYIEAEMELGRMTSFEGKNSDAMRYYRNILSLETNTVAANNLAFLLATDPDPKLRNGKEAVRLAEQTCQLTQYKEAYMIGTLSVAYAEVGRFNDTIATVEKARVLALSKGQIELAEKDERLLELYKSGRAYHEEDSGGSPSN
jgi:hypothetical protein